MDYGEIDSCGIRNLAPVFGRGLRGETLSAGRNRRWVGGVMRMGVRRIIDLRTADYSDKLPSACSLLGLEYAHVPVDSMVQSPAALAERLPTLFKMLDEDGFYISCQQGRHRTDIALALYYFFHNASEVPVMHGHIAGGQLRCDDIMRRINAMRPHFPEVSQKTFDERRAEFLRVNRKRAKEMEECQ